MLTVNLLLTLFKTTVQVCMSQVLLIAFQIKHAACPLFKHNLYNQLTILFFPYKIKLGLRNNSKS